MARTLHLRKSRGDGPTEPGRFTIGMDGQWDIDDLTQFGESFRETYAYFYFVHPDTKKDRDRIRLLFTRYFWSGEYKGSAFAKYLYYNIPDESRLQIASIRYASPGAMELMGYVAALLMIAKCTSMWAKAGTDVLELLERIGEFFKKKKLDRPMRNFNLDDIRGMDIDTARGLLGEMGKYLGFSQKQVEHLVDLTGNPISALRLMVALANESKKVSEMIEHGKLKLPDPGKQV